MVTTETTAFVRVIVLEYNLLMAAYRRSYAAPARKLLLAAIAIERRLRKPSPYGSVAMAEDLASTDPLLTEDEWRSFGYAPLPPATFGGVPNV
jgi:hypothetical protein